jgi:hypothetical protein
MFAGAPSSSEPHHADHSTRNLRNASSPATSLRTAKRRDPLTQDQGDVCVSCRINKKSFSAGTYFAVLTPYRQHGSMKWL